MKDQIQEILKQENITSSQFADKIGVQRSSVSHVISGRNKPGFDFVTRVIEAFPDIDAGWLITGKGEMYARNAITDDLFDKPVAIAGESLEKPDQEAKKPDPVTKEVKEKRTNVEKTLRQTPDEREIERIIVFYSDKTFREYLNDS